MKKTLIIIILILTLTIFFTNIYAADFSDLNNDPYLEEIVDILSAYEILQGYPDNTFRPENAVTRAEMAKIVTVAAGFNEYSKNMTSIYEDMVGHWAESYVELANISGIVKGISPTIYGPDIKIKFTEAYTMILRLLGYTDESLIGTWPSNYHSKARELNLFENLDERAEYATRRDISIMLYNALDEKLVIVRKNKISTTNNKLFSKIGKMETRQVTSQDLDIDNFDYTAYLFNEWDIYYDIKGNPLYLTNPRYGNSQGRVTSILSNKVLFVTDDYGNVRVFQVGNIPIVINGEKGNFNDLEDSRVKVVYAGASANDGIIGIIAHKKTDVLVMEREDLYEEGSHIFAGKYLPQRNSEINFDKLHITGDAKSLEDIAIHDLVYFYETREVNKNSTLTLEVLKSKTEGLVTNVEDVNGNTFYTVNNISYMTGNDFIFTEKASVNDNVTLILDKNNNIIKLYINKYGKRPSTFGLVLSTSNSSKGNATARILDEYGGLRTYNLADNSNAVRLEENGSQVFKQSLLRRNDLVKFDPVKSGTVKIIDLMASQNIAYSYNSQDKTLSNGYYITSDTFIVYVNNGQYEILKPSQLNSYLEGKAVVNYLGHIDAIYLTKGLRTNSVIIPDIKDSYNGTIYGIIKGVTKIDNQISHVQFFNDKNVFSISNTSTGGKNLSSMMNSYIRASVVNGEISTIEKVTPETEKVKLSQIYTNQILIDNITYMEYAPDTKVYICTLDSSGNISNFQEGSLSDLKAGSTAQLYDLYGGFDGIIDLILIFN